MSGQTYAMSIIGDREDVERRIDYAANCIGCVYDRNIPIAPLTRSDAIGTVNRDGYTVYHLTVRIEPAEDGHRVVIQDLPERTFCRQYHLRRGEIEQFLGALRGR